MTFHLVTLECPHCRGLVQIDPAAAGQQVACPLCQGAMQVPSAEALSAAAPTPPPPVPPPLTAPPPASPSMPWGIRPVTVELMSLACPSCGGMFQVPPGAAGMQLPCPTCRQLVTIPEAASAQPAAPPLIPPEQNPPEQNLPEASEPIESLLPPGAADASVVPGAHVPLPVAPRPVPITPTPTEGNVLAIKDRPKVVGEGDDAVEVRRLSPEEKARRRAVRNVILFIVGVAILLAYVVYQSRR